MCLRYADPLSEGFGVLATAPSGKRDFQAMQETFNRWEEQSGLGLTSINRTLALSVDSPRRLRMAASGLSIRYHQRPLWPPAASRLAPDRPSGRRYQAQNPSGSS
jgi:hypothetical protein